MGRSSRQTQSMSTPEATFQSAKENYAEAQAKHLLFAGAFPLMNKALKGLTAKLNEIRKHGEWNGKENRYKKIQEEFEHALENDIEEFFELSKKLDETRAVFKKAIEEEQAAYDAAAAKRKEAKAAAKKKEAEAMMMDNKKEAGAAAATASSTEEEEEPPSKKAKI